MNRIEAIKERLKTGVYEGSTVLGSAVTGGRNRKVSIDVEYLLSKLEAAENAFKLVNDSDSLTIAKLISEATLKKIQA